MKWSIIFTRKLFIAFYSTRKPSGKAEARNVGVLESKSDIIIITDADMIPDENFVHLILMPIKHLIRHVVLKGWLTIFSRMIGHQNQFKTYQHKLPKSIKRRPFGLVLFFNGNLSFPKSYFNLEKGFSLDFKNYGWEDLELGYRFKKRGLPLYYLTSAINYHYHIITNEEQVDRKFYMGQSAQIFIKKHPELKLFLGFNPLSVMIRKSLSKSGIIFRFISTLKQSKWSFLRSFSYWFQAEFNYLSGLLSLDFDS